MTSLPVVKSMSPNQEVSFEVLRKRRNSYGHEGPYFRRPDNEQIELDSCICHSHISLFDLKNQISTGSLDDQRLLDISVRAQTDLAVYETWKGGTRDVKYCVYSQNIRKLNMQESRTLLEAITEDRLIIKICERELMKIPTIDSDGVSRKI
jgi:hypothetical protein